MRILVRTLGLLLFAIGVIRAYREVQASRHPVRTPVVQASLNPSPPAPKVRHHNQPPPVAAKPHTLSTSVPTYVNGPQHQFTVTLFKKDGWFDTKIPLTPDLYFLLSCTPDSDDKPCVSWLDLDIGGTLMAPRGPGLKSGPYTLTTVHSSNDPRARGGRPSITIPTGSVTTLKLRLAGDNPPDQVEAKVRLYVRPLDSAQLDVFTADQ